MRSFLTIILGFALLIALSLFTLNRINYSYGIIQADLSELETYIMAEKWDDATKVTAKLDSFWLETEQWWAILLDHESLNDIEICIKRMEKYIETKEKPSSLAELESLKVLIREIPDSESLRINNIL